MNKSSLEIERKFLVKNIPFQLDGYKNFSIRQGYLTDLSNSSSVRVRQKGKFYFLTVKSPGKLARLETEIELSVDQFEQLWPLTDGKRIEKIRYEIPYNNFIIELDIYSGKLMGLVTAEVEFKSETEAKNFIPVDWFWKEVTDDLRYSNQSLSVNGMLNLPEFKEIE